MSMNDTPFTEPQDATGVRDRQRWLAVLAAASRPALLAAADRFADLNFEDLRAPEVGLAMVRARIANQGDRYNLGEATVTRCAQRFVPAAGGLVSVGVGYVLGRDPQRALAVARLDALLQQPDRQALLLREVVSPLSAETAARQQAQSRQTASSRVRFYTLDQETAA